KQSVFDRRLRIGNCAMMATASNAPFASAIFRKRCDLFEAWVIWLKPKVITRYQLRLGLREHFAAHQKNQGTARERFYYSKQNRYDVRSPGWPSRRSVRSGHSSMATPINCVITVFGGTGFLGRRIVRHLRLHSFCI